MKTRIWELLIFPDDIGNYGKGNRRWLYARWRWQVELWFLLNCFAHKELRAINHITGEHIVR